MTKEDVDKALRSEYNHATKQVLYYGARMAAVERVRPTLEALLAVPGAEDVDRLSVGADWSRKDQPEIDLYLKSSAKGSSFVREVVKALHITMMKEPSGDGLRCVADVGGVTLGINNYLPEGCVVTYVEEWVPSRMERRAKVVCPGGGQRRL